MVSMLHALVNAGGTDPVWFLHGARNGRQHALADEVRRLAEAAPNIHTHVTFSRPEPGDLTEDPNRSEGRLDGKTLDRLLPSFDGEFYLCGPSAWMAAIHEHLVGKGVSQERIHTESFGPVA